MSKPEAIKIVLLGNSGVGKTSIVERFVFNKFIAANSSTLGVMFLTKIIDLPISKSVVKLSIWDTAGQEKYHSIAASYYHDAAATLIVYDVTSARTFEGAKLWMKEVQEKVGLKTVIVLVGNKADELVKEEINPQTSISFAKENNIRHALVSAKDGTGIEDLFLGAVEEVMKKEGITKFNAKSKNQKVMLNSLRETKPNCCKP